MKLTKKLLSMGLLPMAALLMLGSCTPSNNKNNGGTTDGDLFDANGHLAETTITFSTTSGKQNQECLNRIITGFKEEQPNVTVNLDIVSGSYSDIASQTISGFATGDYGDLALVYPDAVADFIDYGKAYNLDNYINDAKYGWSTEDKADYVQTFLDEGKQYTIDGTYSLPFSKSTEGVFYNRAILSQTVDGINNGNPITEAYLESLTWEDFFDVFCPALLKAPNLSDFIDTTGTDYSVLGYDSDANFFITLAQQYGYDYTKITNGKGEVLFNNPEMKAMLKKLNGYARDHRILSYKGTGTRANTFFNAKQVLFSIGSTGGTKYQFSTTNPMDIGFIQLFGPKSGGKKAQILQGPSMAFLTHPDTDGKVDEKRKMASWLFYKFATNEENALDWALSTSYMPVRSSCYETDDYKEAYDVASQLPKTQDILDARVASYLSKLNSSYFTSPAFKGSNTCRDQAEAVMGNVLTKTNNLETTPTLLDTWMEAAVTECTKAIN